MAQFNSSLVNETRFMTDFNSKISGSFPFTAPEKGEAHLSLGSNGQSTNDFYVNGVLVYNILQQGSYNSSCALVFKLEKGDVLTKSSGQTYNLDLFFFPFKE